MYAHQDPISRELILELVKNPHDYGAAAVLADRFDGVDNPSSALYRRFRVSNPGRQAWLDRVRQEQRLLNNSTCEPTEMAKLAIERINTVRALNADLFNDSQAARIVWMNNGILQNFIVSCTVEEFRDLGEKMLALGLHGINPLIDPACYTDNRRFRSIDENLRLLLDSPAFCMMDCLPLTESRIGDKEAHMIADSPNTWNLRALTLNRTGITDEGVRTLAASPSLLSLQWLSIDEELEPALFAALRAHPEALPSLRWLNERDISEELKRIRLQPKTPTASRTPMPSAAASLPRDEADLNPAPAGEGIFTYQGKALHWPPIP
jgi:hypothetical protein